MQPNIPLFDDPWMPVSTWGPSSKPILSYYHPHRLPPFSRPRLISLTFVLPKYLDAGARNAVADPVRASAVITVVPFMVLYPARGELAGATEREGGLCFVCNPGRSASGARNMDALVSTVREVCGSRGMLV